MSATNQGDLVVAGETLAHCPNCGGRDLRVWCRGHDRLNRVSRQEFTYSKCRQCHVVFLSSRPAESEAHKFYPSDYGPYQPARSPSDQGENRGKPFRLLKATLLKAVHGLNMAAVRLSPDTLAAELQTFYRPERDGATLLDFGCGTDGFLNHARNQGWNTLGMDVSPETIERVRRSGHRALLVSPAAWDEVENESLDLVRMNHVLEHLYNPSDVLAAIRLKMKTGAKLHLALPNPSSFTARLFRSRWFPLDCPRHVILYSPAVVKRRLAQAGFSDLRIRHETLTKDFARSLGYVLHDRGWVGHEEATQMKHRQDLAKLFFIPARVAAAWGAADRFHVFARK